MQPLADSASVTVTLCVLCLSCAALVFPSLLVQMEKLPVAVPAYLIPLLSHAGAKEALWSGKAGEGCDMGSFSRCPYLSLFRGWEEGWGWVCQRMV